MINSAPNNGGKTVVEILWRRKWVALAIVAIGLLAAIILSLSIKPKYAATSTILMVAENPGESKPVNDSATKPVLSVDLPSIALSETVLTRFHDDINANVDPQGLRSRIKVAVGSDSNIMPVMYTAGTKHEAIVGANALANEVTRYYRQIATTRFDSLIKDLQAQQSKQVSRLSALDQQLQNSARDYPFIDVHEGDGSSAQESVYQRLIDLSAERDAAQAVVSADSSGAKVVARHVGETKSLAENNVVNNDPVYHDVKQSYSTDYTKLAHLNAFASEAYPGMAELRDAVSREKTEVAKARVTAAAAGPQTDLTYVNAMGDKNKAEAQLAADAAKLASINEETSQVESKIQGAGIASRVSSLRRARVSQEASLSTIAGRLSQALNDRAEAASTGSVVVIDHARYAQKTAWSTGEFTAVGIFVLSLWLAVSAAMVLESLDRRFDNEESIRSVYGAPVIGAMS